MGKTPVLVFTEHPFGKGSLTANGEQYSTAISGIDETSTYTAVEAVTIRKPQHGYILEEISFSLTGNTLSSSTAKDIITVWQISDDNLNWEALNTEAVGTRSADASAAADATVSGVFAPTGNFLGRGDWYYLRMAARAEDGVETVTAKAKSSSWVKFIYRGY